MNNNNTNDDELKRMAGIPVGSNGQGTNAQNGRTSTSRPSSHHLPRRMDDDIAEQPSAPKRVASDRMKSSRLPPVRDSNNSTNSEITSKGVSDSTSKILQDTVGASNLHARTGQPARLDSAGEQSLALSIVPLRRADPIPNNNVMAFSELLQPNHRVVKVQPEAGCPQPGAYAAATSRVIDQSELVSHRGTHSVSDHRDEVPEPSLAAVPTLDPQVTREITYSSSPSAEFVTAEVRPSDTADNPEEPGTAAMGVRKKGMSPRNWIIAGFVLLLLVGVGVGVGVAMSAKGGNDLSSGPTLAPTPSVDPCPLDGIVDACSNDAGGSFTEEIPPCLVDRYEALRQTFVPQFNLDIQDEQSCSPENLALLSLAKYSTENSSDIAMANRYGLSLVYFATGGTEWRNAENWMSEKSYCELVGRVECASDFSVTAISLPLNNLTGSLPSNLTQFLPNLRILDLSRNVLTGSIPHDLGRLLELDISDNQLNGTIPSSLTRSTMMEILHLSGNENLVLRRDLPFFTGAQLTALLLADVNCAPGKFPTEVWSLTTLSTLDLSRTHLTGSLPSEIGRLTNLTDLVLTGNSLNGTLPSELSKLVTLESLYLNENSFNGTIPTELGTLQQRLMNLHLDDNRLSGSIPSELGMLITLNYMALFENLLTGTMPTEIGNLKNIQNLEFYNNLFSGVIPANVCALKEQNDVVFAPDGGIRCVPDYGGLSCPQSAPECCC